MFLSTRVLISPAVLGWIVAVLIAATGQPAAASENCYPQGHIVRLIVPETVDSPTNIYARMLKAVIEDEIGALVTYQNVPGGGGLQGITELLRQRPSGRTLGVLNAADAIVAALAGELPVQPEEFTVLGRIVDMPQGLFTGKAARGKEPQTLRNILQTASTRTWGITGPANFFSAVVISQMLAVRPRFITDYLGPRKAAEAASTGKIDIVQLDAATAIPRMTREELVPLATIGRMEKHIANQGGPIPTLADITTAMGGRSDGVATVRKLFAAGIIIAGPPHIPGVRARCIANAIYKAMAGPAFQSVAAGARMPVAPLEAEPAHTSLKEAAASAARYKDVWIDRLKDLSR